MRALIWLLLICWILGGSYYWTCIQKGNCNKEMAEVKIPELSITDGDFSVSSLENFTFNKSTDKETIPPATDAALGKLGNYLANGLRQATITGLYRSDEEGGEALGMSRANKIKSVLVSKGAKAEALVTAAKEVNGLTYSNCGGKVYGAVDFSFGQNEAAAKELLVGGTTVHFVTGSNDLNLTPEIKTYMTNLEDYFKQEGHTERIQLTGHTDNVGDRNANTTLSKQRAEDVKANLVSHGIPAEIIDTDGKGPDVPVADNATAEGKAANRRVEIRITE